MYRTKTLPREEQESEQERKDYAMLFPLPFSELFANLVQEEQFEGKEVKEQEQEVSKDSAPIHDACYLLQRLLLHATPSEQWCREVQEEREQQFLARYRLVSSLLASKPDMITSEKNTDYLEQFKMAVNTVMTDIITANFKGFGWLKKFFPTHHSHSNSAQSKAASSAHVEKPLYLPDAAGHREHRPRADRGRGLHHDRQQQCGRPHHL